MKKIFALILALSLCFTALAATAEETVQTILQAGTTQAFSADPVDEADLQLILQAGLNATSAINQQPWYFAVVTNQDVMAQLSGGMGGFSFGGGAPAGMSMPEGFTPPAGDMPTGGFPGGAPAGDFPIGGEMPAAPAMPASTGGAKAAMGDSPVAIVVYMNENTSSPNPSFDCGLACQNMVIAANALGYGTKIISSPTMTLNGEAHDALCETLGVDKSYTALAVVLLGKPDAQLDATATASQRNTLEEKASFVK